MSKKFLKVLDKATDSTLVDPNWDAILECVDLIRGGETQAKAALGAIQKRIHSENPHVAHHALLVLEACMKNCGSKFHGEVATNEFMHDLRDLAFDNASDKVKSKVLELLQCWSIAFKEKPEYKIVVDTQKTMEYEGVTFPKVSESEAMFLAESAPDWVDGEVCFRCRTAFGLLTRKHHCRACGQVFCDKCSSNQSYLPRYGIEKEVRVCDGCYEKLPSSKKRGTLMDTLSAKLSGTSLNETGETSKSSGTGNSTEDKERELKEAEEFEINLALAISQSEAEAKEQERQRQLYHLFNGVDYTGNNDEALNTNGASVETLTGEQNSIYKGISVEKDSEAGKSTAGTTELEPEMSIDPELAQYLNKDYWHKRREEQKEAAAAEEMRKMAIPSAPPPSESSYSFSASRSEKTNDEQSVTAAAVDTVQRKMDGDITPTPQLITDEEEQTAETMEFCRQIFDEVSKMVNRINSNRARNRSLFNDTAIQSLWSRLTAMLDQVKMRKARLDEKKTYYESLMDRISNIKYTRAAADQLREQFLREEEERKRREKEEKQREMIQTAALLRHQKHLWLQAQQREQMRRMLGQNAYQGYFPNVTYTVPHPSIVGSSVPQPDGTAYMSGASPYAQYNGGGVGAVQSCAKNVMSTFYGGQCTQTNQMVTGQQPNNDPTQSELMQSYTLQQAVSSNIQPPVSSYSSVIHGYPLNMPQQLGYPTATPTVTAGGEQSTSQQQQISLPVTGEQSKISTALPQQVQVPVSVQQSQIPVSLQQSFGSGVQMHQQQQPLTSTAVGVLPQLSQSGVVPLQYTSPVPLSQQPTMSTQVFQTLPQQAMTQPISVPQFQSTVPAPGAATVSSTAQQVYPVGSGMPDQIYGQQMTPQQMAGMYAGPSGSYPVQGYSYQQIGAQMNYQLPQQQQLKQQMTGQYCQGTGTAPVGPGLPAEGSVPQVNQEAIVEGPLISFD